MKFKVRLTAKAEHDVEAALSWFESQSAAAAGARWMKQLMLRIATLESHPQRCALAVESHELGLEIRELGFGKRQGRYRLLFQIQDDTVFVVRVWHGGRDAVSTSDL